jgi:nuclear pore complex protein Nup98-Nup96
VASTTPAFGAAQPQAGGLFSSQPKPAFSFGAATSQPSTGFGGATAFSTNPGGGGGLFGAPAAKPGGLFGSTPAFGATAPAPLATGFGSSSFGGFGGTTGGAFGAANPGTSSFGFGTSLQPQAQPFQQPAQAAQPAVPAIQQQLEILQHNPYGNSALFRSPFSDSKKVEELLKPTNPAAQKALTANQYKVSPLRNIKPKLISASKWINFQASF